MGWLWSFSICDLAHLSEVIIHFGDALIAIFNNEFQSILV